MVQDRIGRQPGGQDNPPQPGMRLDAGVRPRGGDEKMKLPRTRPGEQDVTGQ